MTPEELAAVVAAVVAEVRDVLKTPSPEARLPPKVLFTAQEMHEITGLPKSFFEDNGAKQAIPSRIYGAYRRWSWEDVQTLLAVGACPAISGPYAKKIQALTAEPKAKTKSGKAI